MTAWAVAVMRCLLSLETVGANNSCWPVLYNNLAAAIIDSPKQKSDRAVDTGGIQNTLFVHSLGALFSIYLHYGRNTIWAPHLRKHINMLESVMMIAPERRLLVPNLKHLIYQYRLKKYILTMTQEKRRLNKYK